MWSYLQRYLKRGGPGCHPAAERHVRGVCTSRGLGCSVAGVSVQAQGGRCHSPLWPLGAPELPVLGAWLWAPGCPGEAGLLKKVQAVEPIIWPRGLTEGQALGSPTVDTPGSWKEPDSRPFPLLQLLLCQISPTLPYLPSSGILEKFPKSTPN